MLAEIPHGIEGLVPIVPFDAQHALLNPGHVSRFNNGFCHLHKSLGFSCLFGLFGLFGSSGFSD
jgi:hypothetical protein